MSDPVSVARTAREHLAQGLAALQQPDVPPELQDVAEPVAQAMSALHRIESTQGAAALDSAPVALQAVRRALSMLQRQPSSVASVELAVEAIAGSLGLVHTLNQVAQAAPSVMSVVPPTQPSAPSHTAAAGWQEPVQQPAWEQPQQPAWQAPAPQQEWQAEPPQPAWQAPAPQQEWQAEPPQPAWQAPAPQQEWQAEPQQPAWEAPAPQPWQGQPQQPAWQEPAPQQWQEPPQRDPAWREEAPAAWREPAPAQQAAWQSAPEPAPQRAQAEPPGQAFQPAAGNRKPPLRVDAELGAHSSSNFYKGLSGNDVIDSGGIFIATYQIPDVGQDLIIKVSLPGGYEFEAMGIVKWTRDAPDSGADAPPGFGAQFTQISPEGRQLVYRYVRNREPLFHDDL